MIPLGKYGIGSTRRLFIVAKKRAKLGKAAGDT
jgi:hypothetical protein